MHLIKELASMFITEVCSVADQRAFLEMPKIIYHDDPNYIRPLDKEITDIFDRMVNPLLEEGASRRWLLWSQGGQCIGRIAGFFKVKKEANKQWRVGGLGFFECIDDQNAADLLFNEAKKWLEEAEIRLIHGPINFGSRHNWWGLQVSGEGKPNFCANYHPPYYRRLFEDYGFELNYQQFTFRFVQQAAINVFFKAILRRFQADCRFEFRQADPAKWLDNAVQFQMLYNSTWGLEERQPPLDLSQVLALMEKLKEVLDWRLIWFAYFNGEPVAFFVGIPELNNHLVQYVNGRIKFMDKFRLAGRSCHRSYERAYGMYYGVLNQFQEMGVGLGLIAAMQEAWMTKLQIPYRSIEFGWVGDYDPKMIKLMKLAGGEVVRLHQTYRYWL